MAVGGINSGLLLIGALFASVGCGPIYAPPHVGDYFRVKPLPFEQGAGLQVQPPRGIPLPPFPPVVEQSPPADIKAQLNSRMQIGESTDCSLTLEDAIRISLSNSGVVRIADGAAVTASPATPFDPEIADALARVAMAGFDPSWNSALGANWITRPSGSVFGPGLAQPNRRDEVNFTGALTKPWISGAQTSIGYNPSSAYLFIPNPSRSRLNPLYTSNLEFALKQSLLKGAGIGVNKAPIRIALLRRDQSALTTRQAVMASVRSVTETYWELYAARTALTALEEIMPLLERAAYVESERIAAERSVRADLAKVEAQLRAVRQQIVLARSAIVQRELRLRNVLGLPASDGLKLVPTSSPMQAPVGIDIPASIETAFQQRPELIRQRAMVRTREYELLISRNAGLPQLDALGLYRWNGVGDHLDDSLKQMMGTEFTDWQTSLTLAVPIGRRAAAANIRAATLQLERERAMLQQSLHSTSHQISALAQEALYTQELFAEAASRYKLNSEWLEGAKVRYENPPPAGDGEDWLLAALNDYLLALRSQAEAATDTQAFLARYNSLLARLSETMGTILIDFDVQLSEQDPV